MPAVRNVLVVGAGAAGTAVAILLAEGGVAVDVIERAPDLAAIGSGITLQGNALRVLRQLGVWDEVAESGYAFDSLGMRAPDAAGTLVVELDELRTGGPDLPSTLGMYRPALARILVDRASSLGAAIRFGTTCTELTQDGDGVTAVCSDGSTASYDLVVGADGVRSSTRSMLGIDLETRGTGMAIWRAFGPRPQSVTRTDLFYGGPSYIAGYCPTGPDTLYAYIVEDAQDRSSLTPEQRLGVMRELAGAYHGPWDDIRDNLTDPDTINYTRFETHLLERPWHRGRVVLIGDAAHTCPPTVAQGAAQALEDAAVLAELLLQRDRLDRTLWDAFMDRRFERSKTVVDASVQVGRWQLEHSADADVPGVMARVTQLVSTPA